MFLKTLLLISFFSFSSGISTISSFRTTSEMPEERSIKKVNQNCIIDGVEVLDSASLIHEKQNLDIEFAQVPTSSDTNWNMVSKNLLTGTLDFFFFDENHYSIRQFAYDSSATSSASLISPESKTSIDTSAKSEIDYEKVNKTDKSIVDLKMAEGFSPSMSGGNLSSNKNLSIMPAGIIGEDNRTAVDDTTISPYCKTGLLISKYNVLNVQTGAIDTLYYRATGFLEGPDLLVTAGHSVYGDVTSGNVKYEDNIFNPRFPDEVLFYPARNGNEKPYGGIKIERVYLEKNYYQKTEKDWACCKLSTKIGNQIGWNGKISNFYVENYSFKTMGYPNIDNYKMYESTAKMTYFESNENGYYYRTDLDADHGQSGSPYIINRNGHQYVCGIHTYSAIYPDSGKTAYTGGIRIDGFMFAFMNSFVDSESLYDIKVGDYGFQDAYPIDQGTQNNYEVHSLDNGLIFRTRRYRTGYIQKEYIVMSPIRDDIAEKKAFIEYSFNRPIEKMYVNLCMWRSVSVELLTSQNGNAYLQVPGENGWQTKIDLLSSATDLPDDRKKPRNYEVVFEKPVYKFRFYSEYNGNTFVDGKNRGRICIGDMRLQFQTKNYMPLSWSELDYNPSEWKGIVEKNNNCYDYAINNQVIPGTNELYFKQQPGEYANSECDMPYNKDNLVRAVKADFNKYNTVYSTNLIFKEVQRYEKCPEGTYKVALVVSSSDYHWYRQDSDGYWSHKRGLLPVEKRDYSNDVITDPYIADRGNYTNFIGYFAVSPWGNMYVS